MGRQRPDTRARVSKACKFLGICMVILIGPVLAVSSQRNALLLLAASIDTTGVLNWSVNTAMCSWTGVTCNAAGSVTTVDLDGLGLMGQLPVDESLWQELDTITNLNLANNDLSGLVPAQISQLTSLHYLSLAGNRLTGSLPSTWSSLKDLVGLDVSHNRISNTLPSTWGDLIALKALDLSSNSLSGGIPYSWTALNLNALSLAGNSGLCASGAVFSPKPDVYYASCLDSSPTLPGINPTYISPPPQPMIFTEDPSAASASISAASANGTLAAELAALGLTLVNGTVVVLNSVDSSSTSSKGALIGGIVGGVLGAVLLVAGGFFAWRWHRSRSQAGAGGAAFSSKNAAFEESEGVEKVAGPAGVAGAVYDVPGTSKAEGEFANPMYGGAEEGAKPANPVYDSGDSPLAPAAGGYPGAAGTAGPSDFTNTAFGEGLDTPKGDTVPSNPLFDTSTSQLSGPGGKAEYDDTKEAPVAAVADFSNPAFADAGMLDTPKGDDGAGPGANPLFDSQTSQLSGPEEGQNYAAGDKPGSRPKAQTPQAWPPANPLFGSDAAKVRAVTFTEGREGADVAVIKPADGDGPGFYAVFDGHGGVNVARLASTLLHEAVLAAGLARLSGEAGLGPGAMDRARAARAAVIEGYRAADAAILARCGEEGWRDGAAAVTLWTLGGTVVVANVGDARAVLARRPTTLRALTLTREHRAVLPAERARIERAGGWVGPDGRLLGRIELSRSLGDAAFKRRGMSAAPDVAVFEAGGRDVFLLLGCDGFWGVFSAQEAVDLAAAQLAAGAGPKAACNRLLHEAVRVRACRDNCTVMLLVLARDRPAVR
ncbi:putative protein phosphatase 2C 67 [Auxenochlorella protothecoides]|uniref:protein-serine/threonine phosphatase n=1 Tax=Auxenochlorella protothecoides TaxID=3075 RepID=A0A087SJE6_AUXPR|nr:putative protein phosphatase 2C 67 [Auxenochlorella protothecoides]KFM25850.1 putative protein phosphatase 2C 67 [Auxenochlorella protothecoides]